MCASAAIWAKMKGVVFGATMEDAMEQHVRRKGLATTWRQINFKAEEILKQGTPLLELYPAFLRESCLPLFDLNK